MKDAGLGDRFDRCARFFVLKTAPSYCYANVRVCTLSTGSMLLSSVRYDDNTLIIRCGVFLHTLNCTMTITLSLIREPDTAIVTP